MIVLVLGVCKASQSLNSLVVRTRNAILFSVHYTAHFVNPTLQNEQLPFPLVFFRLQIKRTHVAFDRATLVNHPVTRDALARKGVAPECRSYCACGLGPSDGRGDL